MVDLTIVQDHQVWELMTDLDSGKIHHITEDGTQTPFDTEVLRRALSDGWILKEGETLHLTNKSRGVLDEMEKRLRTISDLYDRPIQQMVGK